MNNLAKGMVKQGNEVNLEMARSYITSTEVIGIKCVEKDLLEEGLMAEKKYKDEYTGKNVNRSETRLYTLYGNVACILGHYGKEDIKAQGVGGIHKKDLTIRGVGNTYDGVTAKLQVSTDLTYRNIGDRENVIRGIEVRAGSKSLAKNICNNERALSGECEHFNSIVKSKSNITGNYFTSVTFINKNNVDFDKVISSMLALYEMGRKVAVVPFEENDGKIIVLLGAVPKELQLMSVLREE